jgi:hypothetical protein
LLFIIIGRAFCRGAFVLDPSKCHLKQNLIPSWPWSFRHTSCISDFQCKIKYTNKTFCRTPGPAFLAILPVLAIFCPLGPMNFKKSAMYIKKKKTFYCCSSSCRAYVTNYVSDVIIRWESLNLNYLQFLHLKNELIFLTSYKCICFREWFLDLALTFWQKVVNRSQWLV